MTEEQTAVVALEATWRHFYVNATVDTQYLKNHKFFASLMTSKYQCAVAQITTIVAGERIKEIKYPLDWWQAVRERWFPKFILKRWPVKYHTWKIDFLYPEMEMRSKFHPEIAIYDSQRSKGYPHFEDSTEDTDA